MLCEFMFILQHEFQVNPLLSGAEDAKSTVAMGVKLCSAAMGNSIL